MTAPEPFRAAVAESIWTLRPDFVALSVVVRGARNGESDASRAPVVSGPSPPWRDGHLEAWREAYAAFGAKPKRTPSSVESLCRRIEQQGALPRINAVVDLYNAVSVRFALPVGGENVAAYAGLPRLVRASGDEAFETIRDGQPHVETVEPGEVVWRDDVGVTCRRWNWRQSVRTRLDVSTTDMWFMLERLSPMPLDALEEAGDVLVAGLRELGPVAGVSRRILRPA
jgi:DNA/RNA-binding domain of Phe-tRNA-synthetase-like protein